MAPTVRLPKTTYPDGREIDYTYTGDPADDALSRVSAIEDGSEALCSYTYLGAGTVMRADYEEPDVRLDLWGGAAGSYDGIDRFGRVADHRWHDGATEDAVRIKHGYDRNSNRLYRRDEVARGDSAEFRELYAYDALIDMQRGLLSSANDAITSKAFEQDWNLDEVGNWKVLDQDDDGDGAWDLEQARDHDKVNEITGVTNVLRTAWAEVDDDATGNMVKMPKPLQPDEGFTATYDAWNRMVALAEDVESSASSGAKQNVAEYAFDAAGRRVVEKTYDDNSLDHTHHFYYSATHQILEERLDRTSPANLDLQYVWGERYVDDLVSRDREAGASSRSGGSERLYALQDANFRVVSVVDDSSRAGVMRRTAAVQRRLRSSACPGAPERGDNCS